MPYSKKTENGQDIYDMAIQEYGYIDLVFLMLSDNDLEPNDDLETGQSLSFRQVVPADINFDYERLDYFRRNEIRVNTHTVGAVWYWETIEDGPFEGSDGGYWEGQRE